MQLIKNNFIHLLLSRIGVLALITLAIFVNGTQFTQALSREAKTKSKKSPLGSSPKNEKPANGERKEMTGDEVIAILKKNPKSSDDILIEDKIITSKLDPGEMTFAGNVIFKYCIFEDELNLSGSEFKKDLSLDGSTFKKGLDLSSTVISRHFSAKKIIIERLPPATKNNTGSPGELKNINEDAKADQEEKDEDEDEDDTNEVAVNKAKREAAIKSATSGPGLQEKCNDASSSQDEKFSVKFEQMKVTGNFNLDYAVFLRGAKFYLMSAGSFTADHARFLSRCETMNFDAVTTNGIFSINSTFFFGPFYFNDSTVNQLECEDIKFRHVEADLSAEKYDNSFYNITVNGDADFQKSEFYGTTNFGSIKIGKNLEFTDSRFYSQAPNNRTNNVEKANTFYEMEIKGDATFTRSNFCGGFDLTGANIGGALDFGGVTDNNIDSEKKFTALKTGVLRFGNMRLKPESYNLSEADYQLIYGSNRPENVQPVDCSNPSSKKQITPLETGSSKDDVIQQTAELDNIIANSIFSRDTYLHLEEAYRRMGYQNPADWIYIKGRFREGWEKLTGTSCISWIFNSLGFSLNLLLLITSAYGKWPALALLWSGLFIVIGAFVFHYGNIVIQDTDKYKDVTEHPTIIQVILTKIQPAFDFLNWISTQAISLYRRIFALIFKEKEDKNEKAPAENTAVPLTATPVILIGSFPTAHFVRVSKNKLKNSPQKSHSTFKMLGYFRQAALAVTPAETPKSTEKIEVKYSSIWYSIALFLPIVSLADVKIWAPKGRMPRLYMRLHIILGYLLIPIGLAAWTGIIK